MIASFVTVPKQESVCTIAVHNNISFIGMHSFDFQTGTVAGACHKLLYY